jgi:hypothetical protein
MVAEGGGVQDDDDKNDEEEDAADRWMKKNGSGAFVSS